MNKRSLSTPTRVSSRDVVAQGTDQGFPTISPDRVLRKTTTMLFKMLGIENSWQKNRELRPDRPRQLFVTQSRMLADKVEEYFIKLLQSLVLASKTEGAISDLLERQKNREDAGLVDQDEAVNWREDLPQKFSELQDIHFPMFITFDKVRFPLHILIRYLTVYYSVVCDDRGGHESPPRNCN